MSEVVTNLIKSRAGREFLGSKGGIINVASGFYGDTMTTSRGVWQHEAVCQRVDRPLERGNRRVGRRRIGEARRFFDVVHAPHAALGRCSGHRLGVVLGREDEFGARIDVLAGKL